MDELEQKPDLTPSVEHHAVEKPAPIESEAPVTQSVPVESTSSTESVPGIEAAPENQTAPRSDQKKHKSDGKKDKTRSDGNRQDNRKGKGGDAGKRRFNPNASHNGPRRVSGGIRLRSSTGKSARNWWAQRWIHSMENVVDVNRLRRGRFYALQGQVLSIEEGDAEMIAKVQGSRPKPYVVRISLIPFNEEQWEKLLDVLSDKAIFAAQLLSGQMPANIEDAFAEAGVSLFPNRTGELLTDCTCPDWANPCKHVAATHYILGDRFDDDPFLLFRLRGRTQEQIIEGLRRHRLADVDQGALAEMELPLSLEELDEEGLPLEQQPLTIDNETMSKFWVNDDTLADFPIRITAPEINLPIFKRLGEPDAAGNYSMQELLANAYLAVSQASQIIAFTGGGDVEEEEPEEE